MKKSFWQDKSSVCLRIKIQKCFKGSCRNIVNEYFRSYGPVTAHSSQEGGVVLAYMRAAGLFLSDHSCFEVVLEVKMAVKILLRKDISLEDSTNSSGDNIQSIDVPAVNPNTPGDGGP